MPALRKLLNYAKTSHIQKKLSNILNLRTLAHNVFSKSLAEDADSVDFLSVLNHSLSGESEKQINKMPINGSTKDKSMITHGSRRHDDGLGHLF